MSQTNPDSRQLPNGWVSQFNPQYNAWFYVNKDAPGGPQSQWTQRPATVRTAIWPAAWRARGRRKVGLPRRQQPGAAEPVPSQRLASPVAVALSGAVVGSAAARAAAAGKTRPRRFPFQAFRQEQQPAAGVWRRVPAAAVRWRVSAAATVRLSAAAAVLPPAGVCAAGRIRAAAAAPRHERWHWQEHGTDVQAALGVGGGLLGGLLLADVMEDHNDYGGGDYGGGPGGDYGGGGGDWGGDGGGFDGGDMGGGDF